MAVISNLRDDALRLFATVPTNNLPSWASLQQLMRERFTVNQRCTILNMVVWVRLIVDLVLLSFLSQTEHFKKSSVTVVSKLVDHKIAKSKHVCCARSYFYVYAIKMG